MADKPKGYRDTLNLPKTAFSMKADLVQREPQMRKQWAKDDIYAQIRSARDGAPRYILHDGPPYANGDIHMGHVINKVLKDFVLKYKTMCGFDAPYIPGWDCHGLPIEAKVMAELGDKAKEMAKHEVRRGLLQVRPQICPAPGQAVPGPGHLRRLRESLPDLRSRLRGRYPGGLCRTGGQGPGLSPAQAHPLVCRL